MRESLNSSLLEMLLCVLRVTVYSAKPTLGSPVVPHLAKVIPGGLVDNLYPGIELREETLS